MPCLKIKLVTRISMLKRSIIKALFLQQNDRCLYAPGLGQWTPALVEEAERADCLLIDGTLWNDDELVDRGAADKTGREMGHLAQSGSNGMLEKLAPLLGRKILIHINNTNPILDETSPQRARLTSLGIEVAYDGMEIELG